MQYSELPPYAAQRADIVMNADSQGLTKSVRLRARLMLGVCDKTLKKYVRACREGRFEVFVHGNTGRKPVTTIPQETRRQIVDLYVGSYPGASFAHFTEILNEDYGIRISATSVFNILKNECLIVSPAANRGTKIKFRKLQRQAEEAAPEDVTIYERVKYLADQYEVSSRHPRSRYRGELLQMDASSYAWNGTDVWHLHLAVDDATGEVVGAYFDTQETLDAYYHVFRQILLVHGIPLRFHTDKRTCFEFHLRQNTIVSQAGRRNKKKASQEKPEDEESEPLTQFRRTLEMFGVDLIASSEPLFKPRAERMNGTFQRRLPAELTRHGISTIEEANAFLPSYLETFNAKFAVEVPKDDDVFVALDDETRSSIDDFLAIRSDRVISGSVIKIEKKYWAVYDNDGRRIYFRQKTPCTVAKGLTGRMHCTVDKVTYAMQQMPEHLSSSPYVDIGTEKDESVKQLKEKPYIPPKTHPWRKYDKVQKD